jgi:UPF0755 protein
MKPNRLLFFFEGLWNSLKDLGRVRLLSAIGVVALACGIFAIFYWYSAQLVSVAAKDDRSVIVKVKPGMTTGDIAGILQERNLIRDKNAFLFAAKRAGLDKSLQAGEYSLSRAMDVSQMIEMMSTGKTVYAQFTIPEGFTVEQIASLLAEQGLASKSRFLELAKNYAPFDKESSRPNVKYRAEGFLFPDTYRISKGASEEDILQIMANQFAKQFTPELQEQARAAGMSMYDVIVLASLIEREVQVAKERPMVARVFLNRIQLEMPLQSCATIQYILGYPKEELTIADTQIPSPYNSYLHQGFPPGPVANPGISSIRAALNPVPGDWLYFVVDGKTGGHRFSKTLAEHEAAIGQIGK